MGIFILKMLLIPFAAIEMWCRIIVALIMWDKRPMQGEFLFDILYKKRK
jgi:hypothetical protein